MEATITIGALSARTGVATSALRYYESEGLITSTRTAAGHRRFPMSTIRRVSFVRAAQRVGLSLDEVADALAGLPVDRTPTTEDWSVLAASWRPRLDAQIAIIERLRDRLDGCIGCGSLSTSRCALLTPDDQAGAAGPGPRYVLDDDLEDDAEA